MNKPIKEFSQNNGLQQPAFEPNSRYSSLDTAQWTRADGLPVLYVRRRFIPQTDNFAVLHDHVVEENDRLDNIATRYISDPQLYWRICDANGAMNPADLVANTGRRLRITLPEGIPEPSDEF